MSPAWAVWVHTKRQLCHWERSISALGLFGVFPVVILSKENSTFTCHFSFPTWAGKQGCWGAPGPTGNNAHIQPLSSLAVETQDGKEQSAGMCVHIYDYTWWEEDILFKRVVRLGSGKASDVALEAVRFYIHNSTGCKGGVRAAGLSAVQVHTYKQAQGPFQVCFMKYCFYFCINVNH